MKCQEKRSFFFLTTLSLNKSSYINNKAGEKSRNGLNGLNTERHILLSEKHFDFEKHNDLI